VSKVDFTVPKVDGWFYGQMVEEVYTTHDDAFTLKVCRDGRILLRVVDLERAVTLSDAESIQMTVKRWGDYLDYLNAFYLLLDSAMMEVDRFAYFNLHEITNRDAFRVTYENGRVSGENIAVESIASAFQMSRFSSSYRPDLPIEYDSRIMMRHVISREVIDSAASLFCRVMKTDGLQRSLASFAKSLAEYKVGNYETSIVLAWFIIEAAMSSVWRSHLEKLNFAVSTDGRNRINRERKDFLTGRDFTTSIVSNALELLDVLEYDLFQDIDSVRGFRNKIVHARQFEPTANDAQLALKTAQAMIQRVSDIRFTPNFGYSVTGL